jgi:hypothetical protein
MGSPLGAHVIPKAACPATSHGVAQPAAESQGEGGNAGDQVSQAITAKSDGDCRENPEERREPVAHVLLSPVRTKHTAYQCGDQLQNITRYSGYVFRM